MHSKLEAINDRPTRTCTCSQPTDYIRVPEKGDVESHLSLTSANILVLAREVLGLISVVLGFVKKSQDSLWLTS